MEGVIFYPKSESSWINKHTGEKVEVVGVDFPNENRDTLVITYKNESEALSRVNSILWLQNWEQEE